MSTKTEVITKEEIAVATETLTDAECQTIVHCVCEQDAFYRIWASTFLIEHGSGKRAKLITAFNVSLYPDWTPKAAGETFTLIFEGLSRTCAVFDLQEIIPESGGFHVKGIVRNESDVYNVHIG
ncbi:MAG TPA: hypothetical protein VGC65_07015 [Bacteroidia bacterium]|jgi:hypothetical protein